MDEVARFNRERWEELAGAGVPYSRPFLHLDRESARRTIDPEGFLGRVAGRDVLCLAGGGGQQSAAFALLGARVTVLDISPTQLERDRQAAAHYGTEVRTVEGDMRELSCFRDSSFDVVWHAHSLTFVPESRPVLAGVSRILRPRGLYRLYWWNPYVHGAQERWTGRGYLLTEPCADGAEVRYEDDRWDVEQPDGRTRRIPGPREFRHSLPSIVNGLIGHGFVILGLWETGREPQEDADRLAALAPGSWEHFRVVAPPYLTVVAAKRPDLARRARRRR
jgi:SAM-dependent methyltransferase